MIRGVPKSWGFARVCDDCGAVGPVVGEFPEKPEGAVRVVFLDLDGVLNSSAFLGQQVPNRTHADGAPMLRYDEPSAMDIVDPIRVGVLKIDRACATRLNRLTEMAGAMIVVSASCRHGNSLTWLREMFGAGGVKGAIIDKTPDCVPNHDALSKREYGQRGDEIRAWLETTGVAVGVSSFVVLDDEGDMDAVRTHLVKTDMAIGLTDADVDCAIAVLRERAPLVASDVPLVAGGAAWLVNFEGRTQDYCPRCKDHVGADGELHAGPYRGSALHCTRCRAAMDKALEKPCPLCGHAMGDHELGGGHCDGAPGCLCRDGFEPPPVRRVGGGERAP